MATLDFATSVDVRTTPDKAFDYFADHRHVAAVLDGVSRWDPIGSQTRGVGARYDVEMRALGFPLSSVLRLDRWRRGREIGWTSESGLIKQRGGFKFEPTARGVRIELHISYEPPGWIVGAVVARRLDSAVRQRLDKAMQWIKKVLES
jgi:ribosome-associated toxin RatA of RatAB toxin-antitoxin module